MQLFEYPKSFIVGMNNVGSQRAGALHPCDVILDPQNTGLGPEKTSSFQAIHIPNKISKGKTISQFSIILFVGFLVLLVCGILGYVFRNEIGKQMQQKMIESIPLYKNNSVVTDAWDSIHKAFECCGIVVDYDAGYEIWRKLNQNFSSIINQVPESCCRKTDQPSVWLCQLNPKIGAYDVGCYDQVQDFIKHQSLILGGIGIVLSCGLIVGVMLSCAVCMIRKTNCIQMVLKV